MSLKSFKESVFGDLEMPKMLEKLYHFEEKHLYFCTQFELSDEEISGVDIEDEEEYYKYIKPFGFTDDGVVAFWLQNSDSEKSPIIYYSSDGDIRILAKDLKDFLRMLTFDAQVSSTV